ncbi:SCO4402 family protein [Microbulbifer sp. 2201CG32-9]|uniref:SCO4402 family protein n=1 Tax=Microbulbifer sp. 2201CG32-9 TaxID=3232309 RepID=UPI00345B7483
MKSEDWDGFIFSLIKEIADKEFQRKVWFEGDCEEQSSFTEVVCALYDDYNFEDYLEFEAKKFNSTELVSELQKLNSKLNCFIDTLDGNAFTEKFLTDKRWNSIQEEAQQIIDMKERG